MQSAESSSLDQQPNVDAASRQFHLAADGRQVSSPSYAPSHLINPTVANHRGPPTIDHSTYGAYLASEQLRHRLPLGHHFNHCMTTNTFSNGPISSSFVNHNNQASYNKFQTYQVSFLPLADPLPPPIDRNRSLLSPTSAVHLPFAQTCASNLPASPILCPQLVCL